MAAIPSLGWITSPVPLKRRRLSRSTVIIMASRRRKLRSMRQSLANSVAARGTLPWKSFNLASKRSRRANASADAPAKPTSTLPFCSLRILCASLFITTLPSVTWPSPPMATLFLWRTARIVVEWIVSTSSPLSGMRNRQPTYTGRPCSTISYHFDLPLPYNDREALPFSTVAGATHSQEIDHHDENCTLGSAPRAAGRLAICRRLGKCRGARNQGRREVLQC